jgi:AcrR family transcriptional regulator
MQVVPVPRRQLERGGYARGEETRARIIATALRIFGQQGYDHSSTRLIAAQAGVNPPALQYYFGGKEGLHRACAQFIIDRAQAVMSPAFSRASRALLARDRREAVTALCDLLDALTDALTAAGSESWSRFIARGKADGAGPAMPMIRERIGLPLITMVASLVGLATACADDELNRLRALLLLGPVNWIHANREGTLMLLQWREFDAGRLALLKQTVRAHVRAALRAPVRVPASSVRRSAARRPSAHRRRASARPRPTK